MRDSMNEVNRGSGRRAPAVVVRDYQQCNRTQTESVEKGESVRTVVERCRRDIVQRDAQQSTWVSRHVELDALASLAGP
jgi:hypothetical protein